MLDDDPRALVARMLDGDTAATAMLIAHLAPVLRLRAARALARRRSTARGRPARQELDDLVQDTWAALLERGGRALLAWDPERGLDFARFVGLFAERAIAMRLRTRKHNPWTEDPTADDRLSCLIDADHAPRASLEARDRLHRILAQAFAQLGGRGRRYFQLLVVEERSIDAVATATGSTRDAVYAWRSRFARLARTIDRELDAPMPRVAPNRRAAIAS